MQRNFIKILFLVLVFSACSEKDDSSDGLDIFSSDQAVEAAALIEEANIKLNDIKQILKQNESRLEDLKMALGAKKEKEVKEISDQLITQINLGIKRGEEALEKINEAQSLNINSDFKTYLGMKAQSLMKYAKAYEERLKLAILLRDNYDPNNAEQRKTVVEEFERREVIFLDIMKEAGELSREANQFAKDANAKSQK